MKFTFDRPGCGNLIRAYAPGAVQVGERALLRSCILSADTVIEHWTPRDAERLTPEDFDPVLALRPEIVILGTGRVQRFPPHAVRGVFAQRSVGLEVMDMGAACRTYNLLLQDQRRVVAALIID